MCRLKMKLLLKICLLKFIYCVELEKKALNRHEKSSFGMKYFLFNLYKVLYYIKYNTLILNIQINTEI